MATNISELIHQGILPQAINMDYFRLFNLNQEFNINNIQLKKAYLALQNLVHPDKFVNYDINYQTIAIEWASFVNAGFNTLNNYADRASYWCKLHNINTDIQAEMHILEQTMSWYENLEADSGSDNRKLIKFQAKTLQNEFIEKFTQLSYMDTSNQLLGRYAQTLLLIDRFLANM